MKNILLKAVGISLIASALVIPSPTHAMSAPAYQDWDKAQEHVKTYEMWFADRADHGLIPVRKNSKWGFINYQGKFVIKPQYNLARAPFYQGVTAVNRNQLINSSGKVIFYDKTIEYIGGFNDGLATVQKKGKAGKVGFINSKGKYVIVPTYDDATRFYNQVAFVKKGGKWALMDSKGKLLTSFMFEEQDFGPSYKNSALYPVKVNGYWGCINNKGNMVIPAEFKRAVEFKDKNTVIAYHKDQVSAIVKKDGTIIKLDYSYSVIGEPKTGLWKIDGYGEGFGEGIVDESGHLVLIPKDGQNVMLSDDGSLAVKGNDPSSSDWKFYDKQMAPLFDEGFKKAKGFSEGMAAVLRDSKWEYINKQGKIAIPDQFEYAGDFIDGVAIIKKNGKFGIIGKKGESIAPAKYEEITPLFENDNYVNTDAVKVTYPNKLYKVKLNGKYGVMNSRGKILLDIKYNNINLDYIEYFHDIDPIATVWYYSNSSGVTTSFNIITGTRIFPNYRSVYYLGDGMYSGFPLARSNKYEIFNSQGKVVFSSGISG